MQIRLSASLKPGPETNSNWLIANFWKLNAISKQKKKHIDFGPTEWNDENKNVENYGRVNADKLIKTNARMAHGAWRMSHLII